MSVISRNGGARPRRSVSEGRTMEQFDVVGAGLGPFNLSLAALVEPLSDIRARFFETRPSFQWHCGIMVPGAQLQVSFLKDLVTLVDPTSAFSFLSYLASEGRLYRFLIAHADSCSRQEFERYYQCAAAGRRVRGRLLGQLSGDDEQRGARHRS